MKKTLRWNRMFQNNDKYKYGALDVKYNRYVFTLNPPVHVYGEELRESTIIAPTLKQAKLILKKTVGFVKGYTVVSHPIELFQRQLKLALPNGYKGAKFTD